MMYETSLIPQCDLSIAPRESLSAALERQLVAARAEVKRVEELLALLQENPKIERVLDLLQQRL